MRLVVRGIPREEVAALRGGGADANGQPALTCVAEGWANPCRHCLGLIAEGEAKLVLAYRPFGSALPAWFDFMEPAILRGYGYDDWIRCDTGSVVSGKGLDAACRRILVEKTVAYVHIRSKFNGFQCPVDRD